MTTRERKRARRLRRKVVRRERQRAYVAEIRRQLSAPTETVWWLDSKKIQTAYRKIHTAYTTVDLHMVITSYLAEVEE